MAGGRSGAPKSSGQGGSFGHSATEKEKSSALYGRTTLLSDGLDHHFVMAQGSDGSGATANPKRPAAAAAANKNPTQSSASTDLLRTCCSWRPECNPMDVISVHRTLFAHTHTHTESRNNNINIAVYAHTLTYTRTHTHTHGRNTADAFAAKTFIFRRTND